MTQPAVVVSGLRRQFGSRKACSDVTFSVDAGEFLTIFGPNGAGKTTLLKMLATLSHPNSGSITVLGQNALETPEAVRAQIGYISHKPMLYPDLTAEENLVLTGKLYGVANPRARALELLESVELAHRRQDCVRTFSRGMTQRVSIARALMNNPSVLLLDEPHSGLDPQATRVLDSLLERQRGQRTCIMVTHNLRGGYALATHVMIMHKGAVVLHKPRPQIEFSQLEAEYYSIAEGRRQ
jgi:heme exporter protein A